jgi:hypothetical protein
VSKIFDPPPQLTKNSPKCIAKGHLVKTFGGGAYSGSRAFRVLSHQADRGWESLGGNIGGHPGGGVPTEVPIIIFRHLL